jgi:tetratricopeptide (TPR) repeat protein
MKRLFALTIVALFFLLLILLPNATAQEEPRAAWQLTKFDLAANVLQAERALSVVAVLTIKNVGRAAGTGMTVRLNSKATIKSVSANGAAATFRALPESKGNMQRVTFPLPTPVPANTAFTLSVDYRLPVESNTGLEAISPIGSQFQPLSIWYPMLNTPSTVRGADTAPFRLKVEGANVISSGTDKGQTGSAVVYEQPLFGLPFFLQGEWDKNEGAGEAKGISTFLPKGATADERKQAEVIMGTAASARSFYAGLLGPGPDLPIRLVAVRRGAGFNDAGTLLLEWGAFRRAKLDAATAMLLAESAARLWIGCQTPIRGEGAGMLHDALPRYLAALFIEKQFGHDAAEAELLRERIAYSAVAKKDAPLSRSTPLDQSYFGSVPNKGAMVWRLVEHRLGRDAFISLLRSLLQAGKGDLNGLSLAALRASLAERGGETLKGLLDQQLDQPTDVDLLVGLPQQRGTEWVAALRNLGSIDASVTVVATTDRGEQMKIETTVPAQNFGEAVFKTSAKPVRVEIDPDKLYPQLDYANDVAPRVRDLGDAMGEASRFFGAQDYVHAESNAREILVAAPRMQEARILLARALLGQNKLDEAEKLFRSALDETLPTASALAWANVGLGEIALKRGQNAEAARRFNDGVRADGEYASQLTARAARIKAEAASANSAPPVDEAVKTFIGQLDHVITNGTKAELDARVVSGELVRFVGGIVGTKPEIWQTHVLRTEQLAENLVAADTDINAKELGKEQSGTAVLILARIGGAWKLAGIDLFEVR